MKKMFSISLLALSAGLFTGCMDEFAQNTHKTQWGYEGKNGPNFWATLDPKYLECSHGEMQSPIDIVSTRDTALTPMIFDYATTSSDVINNGHTIQVNIKKGSSVFLDGMPYELKQFHFHTPSENNINGNQFPLEVHFVHASREGKLAVIALMFEEGVENPFLSKIWEKFPLQLDEPKKLELNAVSIKNFLPKNQEYFSFMGSLTTPPCTQGVKWRVFKHSVSVSKEQVKTFFDLIGHKNNRPLQETNQRKIVE